MEEEGPLARAFFIEVTGARRKVKGNLPGFSRPFFHAPSYATFHRILFTFPP
jgi:hypothetical protein